MSRAYLRKVCQVHWGNIVWYHVLKTYGGRRGVIVRGQENVPLQGPAIVCSNHPGYAWDPCYVSYFGPRSRWGDWFYWTDAGIFVDAPFRTLYLKAIGCIPVERFDEPALKEQAQQRLVERTIQALDEEGLVVVFPEGVGYAAPPLQPLRNGFAKTAQAWVNQRGSNIPIVPCAQNQVPGTGMVISYGTPLYLDLGIEDPTEACADLVERLEQSLRSLCMDGEFALQRAL